MKPTLEYRFWRPESRARDTDVFPTCCLVAATKMGLCLECSVFASVENDDDDDDEENGEEEGDMCRRAKLIPFD